MDAVGENRIEICREFCNVVEEKSVDECFELIMEYINNHNLSDKVEKYLLSLIF